MAGYDSLWEKYRKPLRKEIRALDKEIARLSRIGERLTGLDNLRNISDMIAVIKTKSTLTNRIYASYALQNQGVDPVIWKLSYSG